MKKKLLIVLSVILICATLLCACESGAKPSAQDTTPTTVPTEPPTQPPTEPPITKVATATVSSVGDMLMHSPIFNACYTSDGTYNFESVFRYFSDYISAADYAAGNLETTLAGTNNGYPYSGYPRFNCPDSIIDGMKDAGFDMILTANNHSYDTRTAGLLRGFSGYVVSSRI